MRRQYLVQFRLFCRWSLLTGYITLSSCRPTVYRLFLMTFQPVNSLLSWVIATEWKQFYTIYALCFTGVCSLTNSPIVKYPLNWGWCAAQKVLSNNGFRVPNGKLLLLSLTKCHGVPCSLPSRIRTKVLKNCKTFSSRPRPRQNV